MGRVAGRAVIDGGTDGGSLGQRPPRILFLDEHLVVVDKPAGMPSVPALNPSDPADVATVLVAGALAGMPRPEAVHRLDRDTSGILILARTPSARASLGGVFERGLVEKRYRALVLGQPPGSDGVIHLPLGPDPAAPPRQRIDPIVGRPATTRWITIGGAGLPVGVTAVDLMPVTGRSHQLRVHLAWLGCPILGDRLYGPLAAPGGRLWLHAAGIVFPHPCGGDAVTLRAPLCLDIERDATASPFRPSPGAPSAEA